MKFTRLPTGVLILALSSVYTVYEGDCAITDFLKLGVNPRTSKTSSQRPRTKGEKLLSMEKSVNNVISYIKTNFAKRIFLPEDLQEISSDCFSHLKITATELEQQKCWAVQMLDAWGKLPNGLASGSFTALGDFDSCLSIQKEGLFQGKYCILEVYPKVLQVLESTGEDDDISSTEYISDPESLIPVMEKQLKTFLKIAILKTGTCLPSSCSEADIEFLSRKALENTKTEWSVRATNCQVKEKLKLRIEDYFAIAFFVIMILIVIAGTLVDAMAVRKNNTDSYNLQSGIAGRTLLCFSILRNTKKLLEEDKSPDSIKIFYGMSFVTTLWIIMIHLFVMTPSQVKSQTTFLSDAEDDFIFQAIRNGLVSFDTLFFMSGALLIYERLRQKPGSFWIAAYITRKLWRTIPPLCGVMVLQLIVYHVGSGPFWPEMYGRLIRNCQDRWWTNFLQFNNFYGTDACMYWTWYSAVDVQLYILALLIVLPIKRHPNTTFCLFLFLFMASVVGMVAGHIHYKLSDVASTNTVITEEDISYHLQHGLFATYLHSIGYLAGMASGYVLYCRAKFDISLKANLLCWAIISVSALTAVFSPYVLHDFVLSLAAATADFVLIRIVWAIVLTWITVFCISGYGGFVTKLLSWKAVGPLSKLTYMVYLVHPIIIIAYASRLRLPSAANYTNYMYFHLGCVLASYCTAYLMSMIFEAPFLALEEIVVGKRKVPEETLQRRETENVLKNGAAITLADA